MRISVLQHEPSEGPGEIGNWATQRGHVLTEHHLYRGEALPAQDDFDLLLVMGGEMNIYQDRNHPWLRPERELVRATMEAGKRAIGICLGAQLIADALGQRVTQNPVWEIGWFPVRFTKEAREKFSFLPESVAVLHWHGDTFGLPAGALRIAVSDGCGEQGFVVEGKCLGLQFHMEPDVELVTQMVKGSSDYSRWPRGAYVQHPEMIVAQAAAACEWTRPLLMGLLDAFMGS
jgi:GMP synthase-like glutamine amidotransferase